MCSTDYEPAKVWAAWAPRARKPHVCDECGTTIQPGESYARVRALGDGYWWGAIRCAACYFLAELIEEVECGGHGSILWGGDGLSEEVREFYPSEDDPESGEKQHWARAAFAALEQRAEGASA